MIASRTLVLPFLTAAALAASPGCGKKEEGGSGTESGGAAAGGGTAGGGKAGGGKAGALEAVTAAAKDANAAVPADLKEKISFAAAEVDEGKVAALVPSGWTESPHIPGSYKPADDAGLGFMTSYSVGTNCDGSCEPKDWAATADKVNFAQFKGEQFTVVKDEQLDGGGRLLVATSGEKTYVTGARWKDGARSYISCSATLDGPAAAAADAFAQACRAARATE